MTVEDFNGTRYHARLTTDHAASSFGLPVLVLRPQDEPDAPGEAFGPAEAALLTLVDATPGEVAGLYDAGFFLRERAD
jgi:hypothetical protein